MSRTIMVSESATNGARHDRGLEHSDSIWLVDPASSYAEVEARISTLWPPDVDSPGRDQGQGGRLFRLYGTGPSFSTAKLQKFALALAGNLRYQTVEIFLSRPLFPFDHATPVMVAAAFRQDAVSHGRYGMRVGSKDERQRQPWKWSGATDLSDHRLKPLRQLLLCGETASDVIRRMQGYAGNNLDDRDFVEFVTYVATATVVAMLAQKGPSDIEGPAPILWDLVKQCLALSHDRGAKGLPRSSVRKALRHLAESYGNLLIEAGDDLTEAKRDALRTALAAGWLPSDGSIDAAFTEAEELWASISSGSSVISDSLAVRAKDYSLPSSVVRLLFEASVRSYPVWLRSATMKVEEDEAPVLHGDLHAEVEAARGRRNKPVNYLTLDAYERAARAILIHREIARRRVPALRSMLLFPYQIRDTTGLVVRGFVRFMNRFSGESTTRRLYEYPKSDGRWIPTPEESALGLATTRLLREKVLELGIMPSSTIASPFPRAISEDVLSSATLLRRAAVAAQHRSSRGSVNTPVDEQLALLQEFLADRGWRTVDRWRSAGLLGTSAGMLSVHERIDACSVWPNTNVHIFGESGVGKEVVARCIHAFSSRSARPFIPIIIAAIPDTLLESELFGHERGVFTGAETNRVGRFTSADTGTLFLDEVTDIPLPMQVKLLRVLQERVVEPLGGQPVKVDIRLISATNRSLPQAVAAGTFREDLFYRLNGVEIEIPPLRERRDDILELVGHQLRKLQVKLIPTAKFVALLLKYDWPGNVRELQSVLESAVVLAGGNQLDVPHLPAKVVRVDTSDA